MPLTAGGLRATALVTLVGFATFLVGLLILAGGPTRFSGASFATVRVLAPWWAWGALMLLFGSLAMAGARLHWMRVSQLGHGGACISYVFWLAALTLGTYRNPTGALTGIGIYAALALMHAFSYASSDLERRAWDLNHADPHTHVDTQ